MHARDASSAVQYSSSARCEKLLKRTYVVRVITSSMRSRCLSPISTSFFFWSKPLPLSGLEPCSETLCRFQSQQQVVSISEVAKFRSNRNGIFLEDPSALLSYFSSSAVVGCNDFLPQPCLLLTVRRVLLFSCTAWVTHPWVGVTLRISCPA